MANTFRPATSGAGQEIVARLDALLSMISSGTATTVNTSSYTSKDWLTETDGRNIASKLASLMTAFQTYVAPSAKKVQAALKIGSKSYDGSAAVTISEATTSAAGLLSASDKTKLNGIEAGAQKNTVTGIKGSSESSYRTGNVNITKANVGLGSVDNTSDANKPVSTAQQAALDLKEDKANLKTLAYKESLSKSDVGLGNVDNVKQYSASNPNFGSAAPVMDGTAAVGSATTYARSDHKHPTDTSRASTAVATTSANGLMSSSDKTKLNGVESGAQKNTVTKVQGKTGAVTLSISDIIGSTPIGDEFTPIYYDGSQFVAKEITLESADWHTIAKISAAGKASEYFSVGDEKTISLETGESVTVQILGFNHDDKADGSGKAGITFGMKNLLATKYSMNSSNTNTGGWDSSAMRSSTMATLLSQLPPDLRSSIKAVSKKAMVGGGSSSSPATSVQTSTDSIWLLAVAEIASATSLENSSWSTLKTYASAYEAEGTQYALFKNLIGDADIYSAQSALIKKLSNGSGSASFWWLRSAYPTNSTNFHYVYVGGYVNNYYASYSNGVCFGFCV